jgi:hypothetical protein
VRGLGSTPRQGVTIRRISFSILSISCNAELSFTACLKRNAQSRECFHRSMILTRYQIRRVSNEKKKGWSHPIAHKIIIIHRKKYRRKRNHCTHSLATFLKIPTPSVPRNPCTPLDIKPNQSVILALALENSSSPLPILDDESFRLYAQATPAPTMTVIRKGPATGRHGPPPPLGHPGMLSRHPSSPCKPQHQEATRAPCIWGAQSRIRAARMEGREKLVFGGVLQVLVLNVMALKSEWDVKLQVPEERGIVIRCCRWELKKDCDG